MQICQKCIFFYIPLNLHKICMLKTSNWFTLYKINKCFWSFSFSVRQIQSVLGLNKCIEVWLCKDSWQGRVNGESVRMCVDLTGLNEYVYREKYILPTVEQSLGMLAGAKTFSKLDTNMGFWQCTKYTTFFTPFGRFHFNRQWRF